MGKTKSFKDQFTFDERVEESQDIIAKYPDRIPVVAERYTKADLPELEKKKYLVPRDMSVGQFIHILSGRLQLAPGKALFVFVKNTLPQTSSLMETVYESFKDEDGFLYMCYSSEKTFGYPSTKYMNINLCKCGPSACSISTYCFISTLYIAQYTHEQYR